jgi:hypothetical protein
MPFALKRNQLSILRLLLSLTSLRDRQHFGCMNSLLSSMSAQDLRRAAEIKEKIDSLQDDLAQILGSDTHTSRQQSGTRRMSAAARANIAAGARARWGKVKGVGPSGNKKIRMKRSPAVRARLAAIAKERWRKAKAAGKKTL